MAKYHKKPVIIEAVDYEPGMEDGYLMPNGVYTAYSKEQREQYPIPERIFKTLIPAIYSQGYWQPVGIGDKIITEAKGERYLCKADIFTSTYEPVEDEVQPCK